MADKTVLRGAALSVTIDAKAHVDFVHRHHPIHRLDRTVALLASNARPDMGFMHEFHEVGQGIDPIPANLERWLMVIGPRLRDRLDSAEQSAAVTADTARHRRHPGGGRPAGVLMAVLAGNLVDAGMDAMAEWNGLLDV